MESVTEICTSKGEWNFYKTSRKEETIGGIPNGMKIESLSIKDR